MMYVKALYGKFNIAFKLKKKKIFLHDFTNEKWKLSPVVDGNKTECWYELC